MEAQVTPKEFKTSTEKMNKPQTNHTQKQQQIYIYIYLFIYAQVLASFGCTTGIGKGCGAVTSNSINIWNIKSLYTTAHS